MFIIGTADAADEEEKKKMGKKNTQKTMNYVMGLPGEKNKVGSGSQNVINTKRLPE